MVQMVTGGESVVVVAARFGIDRKTVRRSSWRFHKDGQAGLGSRRSRRHRSPAAIARGTTQRVVTLPRRRQTMRSIAQLLGIAGPAVSPGRARAALDPRLQPHRYERAAPGEPLHIDIKRLGAIRVVGHRVSGIRQHRARSVGYNATHITINHHSHLAFAYI